MRRQECGDRYCVHYNHHNNRVFEGHPRRQSNKRRPWEGLNVRFEIPDLFAFCSGAICAEINFQLALVTSRRRRSLYCVRRDAPQPSTR